MKKRSTDLSRRQMLMTSGGILVAGGTFVGSSFPRSKGFAQDKLGSETKDLIFRTTDPRNGEPELSKLVKSWLTPTKHFYVRSHAPNPVIDPAEFRLSIEGMVDKPMTIGLKELSKFKSINTTATLTCAGNRRAEFNAEGKVGGVQWGAGAIGNATWGGVSLADVLKAAGVGEGAKHVWFEGLDEIAKGDKVIPFGGSIPIDKAMISEGAGATLLANEMNGESLTPDHGFPLRTVVPGYIGARSVKWLGKIVVSDRPSPNHYVATAYKVVRKTDPIDWSESGPIYRYPINAAICEPAKDATVRKGTLEVSGYALPTGIPGSTISHVRVSSDMGKTWVLAEMTGTENEFCWQLWKAKVNIDASTKQLILRARDSSGGFSPSRVPWNAKGYLQNSWFRLPVTVG